MRRGYYNLSITSITLPLLISHLLCDNVTLSYDVEFNYDPSSKLGPKHWDKVDVTNSEYFDYIPYQKSQCGGKKQSPVDLVPNEDCTDDHQFWLNRGINNFDTLDFAILPHSLRINLQVPDNLDDAARADFSNLSLWVPANFVDVKVGSEHYLNGVQYSGELQITHYWEYRDLFIMIAILIDDSPDEHNPRFEEFIREWEEVSWRQQHTCAKKQERQRNPSMNDEKNDDDDDYTRTHPVRTADEMAAIWGHPDDYPGKANWDIYSLLPTPWYCKYRGSLTVPPCIENINWRIADRPMTVSRAQWDRVRGLLLNQWGDDCNMERSSTVAFEGRVNRPLQNERSVSCCNRDNWKPKFHWLFERFPDDYTSWRPSRLSKLPIQY